MQLCSYPVEMNVFELKCSVLVPVFQYYEAKTKQATLFRFSKSLPWMKLFMLLDSELIN